MKDASNRWSNWSDPVQFTAGDPTAGSTLALRITEIMYHPPVSLTEDGWDAEEFEFIELMNVGTTAIDLTGLRFVEGITFDFAGSALTKLGSVRDGRWSFATNSPLNAGTERRYRPGSRANTKASWPMRARRSS